MCVGCLPWAGREFAQLVCLLALERKLREGERETERQRDPAGRQDALFFCVLFVCSVAARNA